MTPTTHTLICLPDHAPKIMSGTKTTTIRRPRKRPIRVGDTIVFKKWVGVPYRAGSTQEVVRRVVVTTVSEIEIVRGSGLSVTTIDGKSGYPAQIATADGFGCFAELVEYLVPDDPGSFTGRIYGWG